MPRQSSTPAIVGGRPVRDSPYIAYQRFGRAEKQELSRVIDDVVLSEFYGGKDVRHFESMFATYHGLACGVATSSGTAALHIAYLAAGLEPGDEVIVPANAYISAATAALQVNAIPVFADLDPGTFVLDPAGVEERITQRTKLIVPVHLYGQPVDMPALMEVANAHGLKVIEDCAQSHGARVGGRLVGTFGQAACYSLCCRKHVVAGEGGIVLTNDEDLAATGRMLVNKGKGLDWWAYERMGYSYPLSNLQAVLATSSLGRLEREIAVRREYAERYRERLGARALVGLPDREDETPIYFKYPFLLPENLRPVTGWIERAVQAEHVIVERSYPVLYWIPWIARKEGMGNGYPYAFFAHGRERDYLAEPCPVAEDVCSRLLAACTGPSIDLGIVDQTCEAIEKVVDYAEQHLDDLIASESRVPPDTGTPLEGVDSP